MIELAAWTWAQQPKAPGQVWQDQRGNELILERRDDDYVYPGWWCKGGWYAPDMPVGNKHRLVSRVR